MQKTECFVSHVPPRVHPHIRYTKEQNICLLSQANQETKSTSEGAGNKRNGPPPKSKRRSVNPKKNNPLQHRSADENRQLNSEIVKSENAAEVLQLIASTKGALTGLAGGGKLNSINFSTSIHRIAKYLAFAWQNPEGNDRSKILSDPRFALLICGAAEALGGADVKDALDRPFRFVSRELSNIAWAIAKLKIAPPKSVIPVDATENKREVLNEKSKEVRAMVYAAARERTSDNKVKNMSWIPALSELCGHIMDSISHRTTLLDPTKFQLQEFSNILWATATAKRSDEAVVSFIVSSLVKGVEGNRNQGLRPQEWSNSIWALATSGVVGPERTLFPFVADLMDENPDFPNEFKPQELANTAWGVATILSKRAGQTNGPECDAALRIFRHVARQLISRDGEGFNSQETSNTIWSFATVGFGLQAGKTTLDSRNEYTFLVSNDAEGDCTLMKDAVQVAIKNAKLNAHRFKSQELNNFAWALARLEQKDYEVLEIIGKQLAHPNRQVSPQDIGTTLWAFATLDYKSDEIYRNIVRRADKNRARRCKPQELSNVLWALATTDVIPEYRDAFDTLLVENARPSQSQAESDPITRLIAVASQELMNRPGDFKEQEIKDILWSLSRLGVRHPTLFKSVAEHLVGDENSPEITGRGVEGFSSQGMGNLAWSYARQAQLGAEVMQRRARAITIYPVSGRLAHYTVSFIDVGESLLQKLFYAIAEADLKVHDNLSALTPQDLANTAWAFAILGMKHERFLSEVVKQMEKRLQLFVQGKKRGTYFNGQELANSLWALASLNFVRPALMDSIESYFLTVVGGAGGVSVASIARYHNRQELANIAWSCAVFGAYPRRLIAALYLGLLGTGENTDPNYVQEVYKDAGIQSSAVMSIVYLQTVLDLEVPNHSLSLPPGFPDKFGTIKTSIARSPSSILENDTFELELISSKSQLAVGAILDSIGFDHVQEHVIDMATLATEYGVSMPPDSSKEVLSVDMAQVETKIGIEFDGPGHFITKIDNGPHAMHRDPSMTPTGINSDYFFDWSDDHQEPNGSTVVKSRILRRLGWNVVKIPFWDWYAFEGDEKQQADYCRSKLEPFL
eukprot:scaffold874_cov126-Cylindrotheca_fusiformis.AAC.21